MKLGSGSYPTAGFSVYFPKLLGYITKELGSLLLLQTRKNS